MRIQLAENTIFQNLKANGLLHHYIETKENKKQKYSQYKIIRRSMVLLNSENKIKYMEDQIC